MIRGAKKCPVLSLHSVKMIMRYIHIFFIKLSPAQIFKTIAQLVTHSISLGILQIEYMSILQLEQENVCGGCGNSEVGLFAEFNHKQFCSQCFKTQIERHIKSVS